MLYENSIHSARSSLWTSHQTMEVRKQNSTPRQSTVIKQTPLTSFYKVKPSPFFYERQDFYKYN